VGLPVCRRRRRSPSPLASRPSRASIDASSGARPDRTPRLRSGPTRHTVRRQEWSGRRWSQVAARRDAKEPQGPRRPQRNRDRRTRRPGHRLPRRLRAGGRGNRAHPRLRWRQAGLVMRAAPLGPRCIDARADGAGSTSTARARRRRRRTADPASSPGRRPRSTRSGKSRRSCTMTTCSTARGKTALHGHAPLSVAADRSRLARPRHRPLRPPARCRDAITRALSHARGRRCPTGARPTALRRKCPSNRRSHSFRESASNRCRPGLRAGRLSR
jgi:hypothetical protein